MQEIQGDTVLIHVLGRSLGIGNGNPLQHSLPGEIPRTKSWWATVQGVAKRQTQLSTHAGIHFGKEGTSFCLAYQLISTLPGSLGWTLSFRIKDKGRDPASHLQSLIPLESLEVRSLTQSTQGLSLLLSHKGGLPSRHFL